MIDHDRPRENYIYRHEPTDDFVEYLTRTDDEYILRVNNNRTLNLQVEDWPDYRELLSVDQGR